MGLFSHSVWMPNLHSKYHSERFLRCVCGGGGGDRGRHKDKPAVFSCYCSYVNPIKIIRSTES